MITNVVLMNRRLFFEPIFSLLINKVTAKFFLRWVKYLWNYTLVS